MKKTLALAAVMCAFSVGAFAQSAAPMASASTPMMKSHAKKHTSSMKHKKTDKGAMPASAASGAM